MVLALALGIGACMTTLPNPDGTLDAYTRDCLASFQMRYRPARHDGEPDAETAALLHAVTTPEAMFSPTLASSRFATAQRCTKRSGK